MRKQIINQGESGFTLIELVITIAVLAVLALGTIPLVQNSVRRQKEQNLREQLRAMRLAIDEFHRDAIGGCSTGGTPPPADPRSVVMITDCKIFEVDNIDRFPPTIETLVEGVDVKPRGLNINNTGTRRPFDDPEGATKGSNLPKKKVYLRELPIDPITGEKDWLYRSPYQEKDSSDWDGISIFDVRSRADGESLTGEKYADF